MEIERQIKWNRNKRYEERKQWHEKIIEWDKEGN